MDNLLETFEKLPKDSTERKYLTGQLHDLYSDNPKWLKKKLSLASEMSTEDITTLCNSIISCISLEKIISSEVENSADSELLIKSEKEKIGIQKSILVEALHCKLTASQKSKPEEFNLTEYEKDFCILSKLVDKSDYISIYVWRESFNMRYGNALKALLKTIEKNNSNDFSFCPSKSDLIGLKLSLLNSLHWNAWKSQEEKWKIFNFPKDKSHF